MRVWGWTKGRKPDHTIYSRTRYQNNIGTSRADVLAGDHRTGAQFRSNLLLQRPLIPNRLTSVSYSEARLITRSTVTWVELDDLFKVPSVIEMGREMLVAAKILVSDQLVTATREGPGLGHD